MARKLGARDKKKRKSSLRTKAFKAALLTGGLIGAATLLGNHRARNIRSRNAQEISDEFDNLWNQRNNFPQTPLSIAYKDAKKAANSRKVQKRRHMMIKEALESHNTKKRYGDKPKLFMMDTPDGLPGVFNAWDENRPKLFGEPYLQPNRGLSKIETRAANKRRAKAGKILARRAQVRNYGNY